MTTNVSLSGTEGGGIDEATRCYASSRTSMGSRDGRCGIEPNSAGFSTMRKMSVPHTGASLLPVTFCGASPRCSVAPSLKSGRRYVRMRRQTFLDDQRVRLSEAGASQTDRLELASVGVDLQAVRTDGDRRLVDAVAHIVEHADHVWRPSITDRTRRELSLTEPGTDAEASTLLTPLGGAARTEWRPHVALVGGPGQGKSTLTMLLAQAYRTALLAGTPSGKTRQSRSLPANVGTVLADTRARLHGGHRDARVQEITHSRRAG